MNTQIQEFQKKPVKIQAVKFDGSYESAAFIVSWTENSKTQAHFEDNRLVIRTLESPQESPFVVSVGDYVIRGVQGEFYACKPDIFEMTYESPKS